MRGRFNGRVVGQDYTGRNTRHNGRAGVYNAVQSAFAPSLDITLANGLGPLFTYTRATTATVKDFEGLIKSCLSGELRVQGARRVQNMLVGSSENWANGSWTNVNINLTTGVSDPDGGTSATTLTAAAGNAQIYQGNGSNITQRCSIYIRRRTGTGTIKFYADGSSAGIDITSSVTTSWRRIATPVATPASNYFGVQIVTSGDAVDVWHPVQENVTGQSNQNPSEYVSVGVLSSPYHGYFVDGVKYFSYQNGNTVASNVVTEAQGAAITGTIGYLAEGARTNLCLQSNSLTTTWTTGASPTQNVTGPDGATSAWTLTDASAVTRAILYQVIAYTATPHTLSVYVKKTTGAQASYPVLGVDRAGGTECALCTIDTSNGVATVWTAYTGYTINTSSATCVSHDANYWRVSLTFTPSAANYNTTFSPAGTTNATQSTGVMDVAAQGTAAVYGFQVEAGAFASTYQPTTTAAVARNADVLTCPSAGLLENSIGAAYAEIATTWTGNPSTNFTATNPNIVSTFNSANGGVPLYITRTNNAVLLYDDTSGRVGPAFSGSSSIQKVASSWGGSTCSIAVNGTLSSGLTFDGNMNFTNTIAFGCWTDGTYNLFGVIKSIKLYKQKPADAQLQAMTT